MATQQFFQQLSQVAAVVSSDGDAADRFAALLSVDLSRPQTSQQIGTLQDALQGATDEQLAQLVESQNLLDGDWTALELLVTSYLKLCRDIDPWSILRSHDLILIFFNNLAVCLMNNMYGNHLSTLTYDTVRFMMPLVKRVDMVLNAEVSGKKFKRLIYVSSVLSKVFNHLRALKSRSKKSQLILFIVNNLNNIYFTIDSPLLCQNIFANMNLLDHRFSFYPKAQQVEYRYILGRYYLIKNQVSKSFGHLSWAFTNTSRSDENNLMKILRYLIPVSLLVGKIPSKQVIQQYPELHKFYTPLIIHMLNGNLFGFEHHLFQHQEYFKQKHILVILAQTCRVVVFRNLFFNVYKLTGMQTRLYYSHLQAALMTSIRSSADQQQAFGTEYLYQTINESVDFSFVENVCVSLVDNDLIRGNVASRNKLMILSKKDAFPEVFEVYQRKFGGLGQEKWMSL